MKKESHWFSHDNNASADPKLIALTAQQGMAGYGRWWRLVELLRSEEEYKYSITTKFAYSVLAKELMLTTEEAKQFITDCIEEYQLLLTDGEYIWSQSLAERMQHLDKKREIYKERGRKGGLAKSKAQAEQTNSTSTQQLNLTEANNTILQITTTNNNKPVDAELQTEKCELQTADLKTALLADERFTYPLVSSGRVTLQQLHDWVDAFNRLLDFRGDKPESEKDYRRHFVNWFKFRDPQREDPHTFLFTPHNKSPVIIPTNTYLKTPQQITAEQTHHHTTWTTKLKT